MICGTFLSQFHLSVEPLVRPDTSVLTATGLVMHSVITQFGKTVAILLTSHGELVATFGSVLEVAEIELTAAPLVATKECGFGS